MTYCPKCSGRVLKHGETFNWPILQCSCPPDPRLDPTKLPVRRTDITGERTFVSRLRNEALEALYEAVVAGSDDATVMAAANRVMVTP